MSTNHDISEPYSPKKKLKDLLKERTEKSKSMLAFLFLDLFLGGFVVSIVLMSTLGKPTSRIESIGSGGDEFLLVEFFWKETSRTIAPVLFHESEGEPDTQIGTAALWNNVFNQPSSLWPSYKQDTGELFFENRDSPFEIAMMDGFFMENKHRLKISSHVTPYENYGYIWLSQPCSGVWYLGIKEIDRAFKQIDDQQVDDKLEVCIKISGVQTLSKRLYINKTPQPRSVNHIITQNGEGMDPFSVPESKEKPSSRCQISQQSSDEIPEIQDLSEGEKLCSNSELSPINSRSSPKDPVPPIEPRSTIDSNLGITWVKIPEGSFEMGSNDGYPVEMPVHKVRMGSFLMSKTEVTVGQYRKCVEAGRCSEPNTGYDCNWGKSNRDNHPINCVNWGQARTFAKWVGADVDLPSEAEWEYAARGGQSYLYAGSNDVNEVGWYSSNSGGSTHSVGKKKANGFGLYDMSGNVWEWTLDEWHNSYSGAPSDRSAWGSLPTCRQECDIGSAGRVDRGGSWSSDAVYLRVANRGGDSPACRDYNLGFRLRKTIP